MFKTTDIVSTIDTNDEWFSALAADRIPLPGSKRIDAEANVVTRAQAGIVIRGLQQDPELADLQVGEACDIARGPRYARLRGRQHDFNVVNYFAQKANAESADEPLTPGQETLVDTQVRCLLGTMEHWRPEVNEAIAKLSQDQRDKFVDLFEACETRGDLTKVLARYERRVPNPAVLPAQDSASAQVADLDITNENDDEESF